MSPHHLILGGQRSGKSRHAERLAQAWLQRAPGHEVTVVATALGGDEEMRERIARHRRDRPTGFAVAEVPVDLGATVGALSAAHRLIVIDCLTLWATNVLMPVDGPGDVVSDWLARKLALLQALAASAGPVLLVSNEIGMGVVPMGPEVRRVVDELGRLHQDVAQCCGHITLMVAGQPFTQQVQRWA